MPGHALRPRDIVQRALPPLDRGMSTTTSVAWGPNHFAGNLQLWDSFEQDVKARYNATRWTTHIVSYTSGQPPRPTSTDTELVACGDENGVQGGLLENLGQSMTAVCLAAGIQLKFGMYIATVDRLTGALRPDVAIMTTTGYGQAVGEVKTPWVQQHQLRNAVSRGGLFLRQVLGMLHSPRFRSRH